MMQFLPLAQTPASYAVLPDLYESEQRALITQLIAQITWEKHDEHRLEAFFNRAGTPYQYGVGRGFRPQFPQPEPTGLQMLWGIVEREIGVPFEACFINYYMNAESNLGWHSDDSPSIDQRRPVCILSLGAARDIEFRPYCNQHLVDRFRLEGGSLLAMHPGMQATHQHRAIPGGSGAPRLSLVFRGLKH